jgi:hypothetical protein
VLQVVVEPKRRTKARVANVSAHQHRSIPISGAVSIGESSAEQSGAQLAHCGHRNHCCVIGEDKSLDAPQGFEP